MSNANELVPLSDFHTFVRPLIGDAPDLLVDHALQEAILWFCQESRVLVDETTIHFQPHVRDYALMIPEHQFLMAPDLARLRRFGHRMGNPADYFFIDVFGPGRCGHAIHRDGPYPVLVFEHLPINAKPRTIHYSWSPHPDFCDVPREIYDQWIRPVKYRAAAELFEMPGESWSSQNKAGKYRQLAEVELEQARVRKAKNYTYGVSKMRAPPFLRNTWLGAGTWGGRYY